MAGEVSFDVVSDFDEQELRNALDQVRREVGQRYDFKGVTVDLTQAKTELVLVTDDEYRAAAVKDLIESKAIRRNLSLKIFDWGKVEPAGGSKVRQEIKLRRGLTDDIGKRITKLIRDDGPTSSPDAASRPSVVRPEIMSGESTTAGRKVRATSTTMTPTTITAASTVRVETQKLADGVYVLGGATHNSVAVEFKDYIAVVEAPQADG